MSARTTRSVCLAALVALAAVGCKNNGGPSRESDARDRAVPNRTNANAASANPAGTNAAGGGPSDGEHTIGTATFRFVPQPVLHASDGGAAGNLVPDPSVVQSVVRSHVDDLRACFVPAPGHPAIPETTFTLHVVAGSDGNVQTVEALQAAPPLTPEIMACIASSLHGVRLPATGTAPMDIEYPFRVRLDP